MANVRESRGIFLDGLDGSCKRSPQLEQLHERQRTSLHLCWLWQYHQQRIFWRGSTTGTTTWTTTNITSSPMSSLSSPALTVSSTTNFWRSYTTGTTTWTTTNITSSPMSSLSLLAPTVSSTTNFLKDLHDRNDHMNDNERHFISHVLASFTASDGITKTCMSAFRMKFKRLVTSMENIHSKTYSLLINALLRTSDVNGSAPSCRAIKPSQYFSQPSR